MKTLAWVVWNKTDKKVKITNGMFVYTNKVGAWLAANKQRKGSPFTIVKVKITTLS